MTRIFVATTICLSLSASILAQPSVERPNLNDDAFRERVRENYSPVGGPEPVVTEVELEILKKAYAMLGSDTQFAYAFLQETLNSGAPVSPAFHNALGNVYFANGNHFQAESQFRAAVEKHPTFRRAWNGLGLALYQQSDFAGASAALANSVRYGANDATTYGILGYCHLRLGRYRSAETAYNYAVLFDPENTEWAEGMGQVYYETSRFHEAISMFDDLIRVDSENNEYWLLKANAWLALDKPLQTARCIEIARRLGEIDADSLYLLGKIYLDQGIFHQARSVFVAAASDQGEVRDRDLLRAIRYLVHHNQHEFAEELFALISQEGDEWSKDDKKLYRFLAAEFAYFRGELEESERAYESGLQVDPFNAYALMKLADIKSRQGEIDQAIVYLDRAATLRDSRYTALLTKAMLLIDDQRFRLAQKTIEQAMAIKSEERVNRLHAQVKRVVETNGERPRVN